MMSERKTRVLGKMLPRFIGKEVIVLGRITNIGSSSNTVELTTFDNVKINVNLKTPLDGVAKGILEAWGTAKSKGSLDAEFFHHFSADNSQDFDGKAYNDMVIIKHAKGMEV